MCHVTFSSETCRKTPNEPQSDAGDEEKVEVKEVEEVKGLEESGPTAGSIKESNDQGSTTSTKRREERAIEKVVIAVLNPVHHAHYLTSNSYHL